MPYKYVIKCKKGYEESIVVEAWPKMKELALPEELKKPSFVIGKVKGKRTIMLWHVVEEIARKYGSMRRGKTLRIELPPDNIEALADAYRLGLAAAAISTIPSDEIAESALRYIMRSAQEEIWFWASKFLHVIDEGVQTERVIEALCLISAPSEKNLSVRQAEFLR